MAVKVTVCTDATHFSAGGRTKDISAPQRVNIKICLVYNTDKPLADKLLYQLIMSENCNFRM